MLSDICFEFHFHLRGKSPEQVEEMVRTLAEGAAHYELPPHSYWLGEIPALRSLAAAVLEAHHIRHPCKPTPKHDRGQIDANVRASMEKRGESHPVEKTAAFWRERDEIDAENARVAALPETDKRYRKALAKLKRLARVVQRYHDGGFGSLEAGPELLAMISAVPRFKLATPDEVREEHKKWVSKTAVLEAAQ